MLCAGMLYRALHCNSFALCMHAFNRRSAPHCGRAGFTMHVFFLAAAGSYLLVGPYLRVGSYLLAGSVAGPTAHRILKSGSLPRLLDIVAAATTDRRVFRKFRKAPCPQEDRAQRRKSCILRLGTKGSQIEICGTCVSEPQSQIGGTRAKVENGRF